MHRYIVQQANEVDCGAACLASIIKYYRGFVPLEIIKVDTLTNHYGTNFYHLKLAALKYGLVARGLKVDNLMKPRLPCVAQLNVNGYNHFVVIYKINKTITLMDPSKGMVKLDEAAFNQRFSGYILEIIPNGKVIRMSKQNAFIPFLKGVIKSYAKELMLLLILSLPIIGLTIASSFNFILIMEYQLVYLAIIFVSLNIFLSYIKNYIMALLNQKINLAIIEGYLEHIFNLPLKYLQLKKSGELTNLIKDLYQVKDFFSKVLVDSVFNTLLLVLTLIVLLLLNYQLTLIMFLTMIAYFLISYWLNTKLYQKITTLMNQEGELMDLLIESLSQIKTIKNSSLRYFLNRIKKQLRLTTHDKYRLEQTERIISSVNFIFEESLFLIILVYHFYCHAQYLSLMLYFMLYNYYFNSFKYYLNLLPVLMYFKSVFNRLGGIFSLPKELSRPITKSTHPMVKISNLSFSYNQLDTVLVDLNLWFKTGDKVLITGQNGSGKSTLLDIISGNQNDYQGKMIIKGIVSYIPQSAGLFKGTILENILLGQKLIPEKLNHIANITALNKLIEGKSYGYETPISSFNLSGGEKQKIILARGLYQDFDILLLDESLSQIAPTERELILKHLFNYYQNKIIIHVSHQHDQLIYGQRIILTARKEERC